MRTSSILAVSLFILVLGAMWVDSDDMLLRVVCGLFWGAIVGAVLFVVRWGRSYQSRGGPEESPWQSGEDSSPDPWVDASGVHRFPGDVFDIENHPRPGANGHI
jgi:hypothetical protein